MRRSGIRQQTFLVALIPIIVMTALLAGYFLYGRFSDLDSALLERSQLVVRQLAFSSEYAVFSGNMAQLKQDIDATLSQPDVKSVMVLDADSRQLLEADGRNGDYELLATKVNSASRIYQDKNVLLLYQPIVATQIKLDELVYEKGLQAALAKPLGAVIIEISKARLNSHKNELFLFNLVVVLLVLAVSLVVALWATRRITRPILDMEVAIRLIGAGNLDTRTTLQSDVDELNELATGINKMAQQLRADRSVLEQRIAEATRELRDKSREALLKSEQRLQEIINVMPVALFIKDTASRIVLMNRSCEEQWGMAFSDLVGTDASQFFPPEQVTSFLDKDKEVFAGRQLVDFEEVTWNAALKKNRVVHTFKKPVFDGKGNPLYLIGISIDITERKQMQEELWLRAQILDSASDTIFLLDLDGNFIYLNEAAWKSRGYTRDEMMGINLHVLVPPEHEKHFGARLEKLLENGEGIFQSAHRRKDGSIMPVEIHARLIESGGRTLILSAIRDITERKHIEEELRNLNEGLELRVKQRTDELAHAKEQAEAANRAKSDFLANMSHEIRTPMNSILGMAQLALKNENNPKQRDYLKKIRLSGEHLLGIIDEILDFSKIDAGKLSLEFLEFDLGQVKQALVNMVTWRAGMKGLKLTFDFDSGISHCLRGDPLRLNQILINYIDNAIKFTQQGEIVIRARKLEENENNILLRFEVQDTGIGITEEQKTRLFQTFHQADSSISRKYGGSGLGLVISQRLAAFMGGEVGVESQSGRGSTFWASVRVEKVSTPELDKPEGAHQVQDQTCRLLGSMESLHGARILLAEDSPFNQQIAIEFLEDAGAVVCVADSGEEALEWLRQERFDCVLMDMQMPGMDGLEATRLIRGIPALAKIPVIAVTANASNEDRERCLAAGMDDFIGKPFEINNFYATIAKWLPPRPQQGSNPVTLPSSIFNNTKISLAGDPDIIDLAVLRELIGDDPKRIHDFALKFIESAREDIARIEKALECNDTSLLSNMGHRAKSPARMVGAIKFANLCQALENGDYGGSTEKARSIVSQLRPLLERIEEQIDKLA